MKKLCFLLSMAVGTLCSSAISSGDAPPEFYASMYRSDEWGQKGSSYNPKYGMYRIPLDGAQPYTRLYQTESVMVQDGGFYLDGKYHWVTSNPEGAAWKNNYVSVYHISDAESFNDIESFSTQKQLVYGSDFTYDYTAGCGWAVGAVSYASADNPLTSSELKRIDTSTGTFTSVGSNNAIVKALACDGEGRLWGIGVPLDKSKPTNLYKIDKSTGAVTVAAVIDKNLYTSTKTTATFDLRNGRLYWSATTYTENEYNERTFESAIYEVNTSTGQATVARRLEYAEVLVGMVLRDCHAKAPQAVSGLDFAFSAGSATKGKTVFTLPTATFDHSVLSGPLSVTINIDGIEHTVNDLTPGQTYEDDLTVLDAGIAHRITVTCFKDNLKSLPAYIEAYAGTDTPAAVTDINVEASERGDIATISWTAPTAGAASGYIDTEKLRYTVIRRPEMKTIATGLTETRFTDNLDRVMSLTQYEVKASVDESESEPAFSTPMLLGTANPIPYLETFDSNSSFLTYTVIDNNHDANDTDGGTWYWNQAGFNVMYFTNLRQADDYFITPTLDLSGDKVYKFQFQTYGYMGGDCHFTVNIGRAATPESQARRIVEEQFTSSKSTKTFYTLFRPEEGECRMSIRNISDGSDHMYLDNILVEEYGSIDIPDIPTALSATRDGRNVRLRFTTPATSVRGDRLSAINEVKIYRAGELTPTATLTDITPATETEWVDENPSPGINQYIIKTSNTAGDGLEADISINTNNDIPKAVTDIRVDNISGYTETEISWIQDLVGVNGLDIPQGDISYDIYRNIGVSRTLIAENIEGTSYTDRGLSDALGDKRQEYVAYTIIPQTNGGKGQSTTSATKLVGRSYGLPYSETFRNQAYDTYPWSCDNPDSGSWYITATGYDPYTAGQDGTGLSTFSINRSSGKGQADYVSPRIDVSSFRDVEISFYVFHSDNDDCRNSVLQLGFVTDDSDILMTSTVINVHSTASGWQRHTVSLPEEYTGSDRLSLVFRGKSTSYKGSIHIDNISVAGVQPEHEVMVAGITGPERCLINQDNNYIVEVVNVGSENNGDITVRLLADGVEVGTQKINSIVAGASQKIGFFYKPGIANQERVITIAAEIEAEMDENTSNNHSEITASLVAPMLPYVTDITGESADGKAILRWSDNTAYPHTEYVLDDVESHKEFAIDGLEGWTFIDVDKASVAKLSFGGNVVQWENTGEPQAFIVFNTASAGTSEIITPKSGTQCFISWESTAASGNDDWMISPALSTEPQTISFYAKALYPLTLDEKFEVWVSYSTNDDISAFTKISGSSPVTVNSATEWTKHSYQLPEGVRYFAIRCVSRHQFGLMIDDITYSPAHAPVEFWGYNVYRDDELITEEAIGDSEYEDSEVEPGKSYKYNVTALYDAGETIYSNDVLLEISGRSAIDGVNNDKVTVSVITGGIKVTGAFGKAVNIYSMNGMCLYSIRGTGHDVMPLSPGTYIVAVDSSSAKVAVK